MPEEVVGIIRITQEFKLKSNSMLSFSITAEIRKKKHVTIDIRLASSWMSMQDVFSPGYLAQRIEQYVEIEDALNLFKRQIRRYDPGWEVPEPTDAKI